MKLSKIIDVVADEIQAPNDYSDNKFKVFLSGSIDMGAAEDWQAKVVAALDSNNIEILNPRREDWDSSWEQSLEDERFVEQVEWELNGLEDADLILVYFDPNGEAPITLMELGIHTKDKADKMIVCCPEGYFRKRNVDVMCRKYGIQQADNIDELIEEAQKKILNF